MLTFQFPQKLLLVLMLIAVCTTKSMSLDLCPTIDFNTLTCGSLSATTVYEINNYSNVKKVIWTVEGGEIIQIGDYSAESFGQSFCYTSGYDWQQATNFTSISYDRENNGSATFFDNVT